MLPPISYNTSNIPFFLPIVSHQTIFITLSVTFSSDIGPIISLCLIFPYHDPFLLSFADYIRLPRSFLLSLISVVALILYNTLTHKAVLL